MGSRGASGCASATLASRIPTLRRPKVQILQLYRRVLHDAGPGPAWVAAILLRLVRIDTEESSQPVRAMTPIKLIPLGQGVSQW